MTARELEAWSDPTTGFESLMSSPAGRQIFQKFLAGEFSAENLIFWTACNDLKSVKKKEIFKERVEKIFLNHLDTSSQYEVNVVSLLPTHSKPIKQHSWRLTKYQLLCSTLICK